MNESNESSRFTGNAVMSAAISALPAAPLEGGREEAGQSHANPGGVPVLRSSLLEASGFCHAFFTRLGGVSRAPWDSLNFLAAVGDDPAAVAENRRRAASALGLAPDRLYFLSQVHGTAFRVLDGTEAWDEVVRSVGDITVSRMAGVGCGVRTADCVPVLLADRRSGAVAAVHSGWRGTADRVVTAGVRALRDVLGAGDGGGDLIAAIGPHIEACCFEVGEDVAGELARASAAGESAIVRGGQAPSGEGDSPRKPRVDLRRIVRSQLEEMGLAPGSIDDVPGCTVCDQQRFHSFRRDRDRSGRLLSAIVVRARGKSA